MGQNSADLKFKPYDPNLPLLSYIHQLGPMRHVSLYERLVGGSSTKQSVGVGKFTGRQEEGLLL